MVCMRDMSHVRRCRSTSRVRGDTLMAPGRTAIQVRSAGGGRAGIRRLLGKALTFGMPQEGSGSVSMQPVGCTLWYSTDTVADVAFTAITISAITTTFYLVYATTIATANTTTMGCITPGDADCC